jgi:flavin-dependent dehydrogenase
VGGGPAGAVCALALARAGMPVTLVHRRRNQPAQIDLVSGHARRLLESQLGRLLPDVAGGIEIHETLSLWGTSNPVSWSAMCNPWGNGLAVDRATLDHSLLRAASSAGASILSDTEVRSATYGRGVWQLGIHDDSSDRSIEARFLVLATGCGGRNLLRRSKSKPAQLAIVTRIEKITSDLGHTLHLESGQNGWWYMLPDPEGGSFVGFCTDFATECRLKRPLRNSLLEGLCKTRLISSILPPTLPNTSVSVCAAGPRTYNEVSGDDWIAIGDSAFVSNPLSGSGIDFAIESATQAARIILSTTEPNELRNYSISVATYAKEQLKITSLYDASRLTN